MHPLHSNMNAFPGKEYFAMPMSCVRLHDVRALTAEIRELLVLHKDALNEDDIRRELGMLEEWIASYRKSRLDDEQLDSVSDRLSILRSRLWLAADRLQRLDNREATRKEKDARSKIKTLEAFLTAISHIDRMMPEFEKEEI